ncbi:MAG: hypothetical protein ACRDG3_09180, partial [Tepidiformaceae bacterium]
GSSALQSAGAPEAKAGSMSAALAPRGFDPWLLWRLVGAAVLAGALTWFFVDWLNDGYRRPALATLSHLGFIVLVPAVVAGIATRFRPQRREWLALGLIAAATMAGVFAHDIYDKLTYDNSREAVWSSSASALVMTLCAGMALVLASFVLARWQALNADG